MPEVIYDRFRVRRGLAATWAADNPVPLDGEISWERDTGLFKIGNGVAAFNDLAYANQPGDAAVLAVGAGDFTLSAASHRRKMLLYAGGAITLPPTVAAAFAVNDVVEVRWQSGAGVTFAAGVGVTLDFNSTLYSAAINSLKDVVALKVIATDTWAILGPLADA